MAPRDHVQQLRGIEQIRALQHFASELEALRAARDLEQRSQECRDEARHLEGFEAGWRHAVEGGSIVDPTVLAWSAAIYRQTGILAESERQLASSRSANTRARRDWQESDSRHSLATETADAAFRRLLKRLEENRAAELIDQYLIRRELP
jgi:hypothetical protein